MRTETGGWPHTCFTSSGMVRHCVPRTRPSGANDVEDTWLRTSDPFSCTKHMKLLRGRLGARSRAILARRPWMATLSASSFLSCATSSMLTPRGGLMRGFFLTKPSVGRYLSISCHSCAACERVRHANEPNPFTHNVEPQLVLGSFLEVWQPLCLSHLFPLFAHQLVELVVLIVAPTLRRDKGPPCERRRGRWCGVWPTCTSGCWARMRSRASTQKKLKPDTNPCAMWAALIVSAFATRTAVQARHAVPSV